ncbi:MAG: hypothetical protein HRU19_18105 [Pseudobacteriovorax sp.]|nr:hypothetical protein [Pseudobacteriovorax sp.]
MGALSLVFVTSSAAAQDIPAEEQKESPTTEEPAPLETDGLELTTTLDEPKPKTYRISGNYRFTSDFRGDNPLNSFSVALNMTWNDKLSFGLSQALTQKIYSYATEDQVTANDSVLSARYNAGTWLGLNHSLSSSFTIPISRNTRRNQSYSTFSAGWSASHSPVEKLSLTYGVNGSLYTSKYRSTPSSGGRGGSPLPISSFGFSHSGSYALAEKLSGFYSLGNSRVWYYDLSLDRSGIAISEVPDDLFSAGLGLSTPLSKEISTSIGYSKGNVINQAGTIDFAIFDEDIAFWYVSIGYSKPF